MSVTEQEIADMIMKMESGKSGTNMRVRSTYHVGIEAMEIGADLRKGMIGFQLVTDYIHHQGQDMVMAALGQEVTSLTMKGHAVQVVTFKCWDDSRGWILLSDNEIHRVYWYEVSRLYTERERPTNPKAKPATVRNTAKKKES